MQLAECQPDLTKMTMDGRLSVNRGFKGVSIEGINTRQRMPSVHDPKIQSQQQRFSLKFSMSQEVNCQCNLCLYCCVTTTCRLVYPC